MNLKPQEHQRFILSTIRDAAIAQLLGNTEWREIFIEAAQGQPLATQAELQRLAVNCNQKILDMV